MTRVTRLPGWILVVHLAGLLLAFWTGTPPPPRSPQSSGEFSAASVERMLAQLMGDGQPRPVGSRSASDARARIVAAFEAIGYRPEVQSRWTCGPFRHYCAEVHNVVARLETGTGAGAVLLNAHYDTVPASPGAADCLAGVASVLEAARALRASPPRGDVVFLINDGEEAGLLGATAFIEGHRWAGDVRAVINLEARGSGGPSWPAYSSGPALPLLRAYLASAERRAPGSLALAFTSQLPLANDISLFDRAGIPGLTLGFARHPRRYHTPRDDLAHLSRASLDQHGRQALALARALAGTRAVEDAGRTAARSDTAANTSVTADARAHDGGTFVAIGPVGVAWSTAWATPLAIFALVLVTIAAATDRRRGSLRASHVLWGLVAFPLVWLIAFFGAASLNAARRALTEIVSANVSAPLPSFLGFALAGLAIAHLASPWFGRKAGPFASWLGLWLWWAALGVVLARVAPQASYLTLVPVLVAGVSALTIRRDSAGADRVRTVLPALAAALVWYPNLVVVYDLAGLGNLPPVAGLVAMVATTTTLPAAAGSPRVWGIALLAASLACIGYGTRVATFTDDQPQFANLTYTLDTDRGRATWTFTGSPLPASLRSVARFGDWSRPVPYAPQEAGFAADAPLLDLDPPRVDVTTIDRTEAGLSVRARLVSPRGAPIAQLAFPADRAPHEVRVRGVVVPEDAARFALFDPAFRVFTIWTLPSDGIEIELAFGGSAPVSLTIVDRSEGLPEAGRELLSARPAWSAPVGSGDQTIVVRALTWR